MQLQASMPTADLDSGTTLVLEAIDPSTGLPVNGVQIGPLAVFADDLTASGNVAGVLPPLVLLPAIAGALEVGGEVAAGALAAEGQ